MKGKAAVLGYGAVTPLGNDFTTTWNALLKGRSAIRPIRRFDATRYPVQFGAEVALEGEGPNLYAQLLDRAADEAAEGLNLDRVAPNRMGVFMGSEAIRPSFGLLAETILNQRTVDSATLARHAPMMAALQMANRFGVEGPVVTLSTACTSSGQALGEALLAIRRGEVDIAIAGGVDVLVHPLMVTGFARLGALSTMNDAPSRACRPFDLGRNGFVLGEGSGLLVLGSAKWVDVVGPCRGWLSGYGCSSNAWRITDSPPDGRGASSAMLAALKDAGRMANEVVYVNAHGTGTLQNDVSEARGIRVALGESADHAFVGSTKSMMGHLVAACGAVEAMVALQAVTDGIAPPSVNLETPDPDCRIRHVSGQAEALGTGVAMSNAFGFGGSNASLVLEAP